MSHKWGFYLPDKDGPLKSPILRTFIKNWALTVNEVVVCGDCGLEGRTCGDRVDPVKDESCGDRLARQVHEE